MKIANNIAALLNASAISRLWERKTPRPFSDEMPLRAELFGVAQLESHARRLAEEHQVDARPGAERLLLDLRHNERVIRESHQVVAAAARDRRATAPAAEWLLDNFYLIEEQVDIARDLLPPGYSRELPRLTVGTHRGYPRVYELALEIVSHTDGRVDMENLSHFIAAYQTVAPLRLGELWAIPIMLRLALIENLRRVAHRIAARRRDRDEALLWAERFLDVVHKDPRGLITALADFVRARPSMSQAFIAELATSLHGEHSALGMVISWLEQDRAELGQTIEQLLQAESNDQAADQVSIGNSITSLRTLSGLDWREFVESLSVAEAELRRDPAAVYSGMSFRTRDRYRHAVERLARRVKKNEEDVAAAAVKLAAARRERGAADRRETHVGYFLVDQGRRELEDAVGYRRPFWLCAGRCFRRRIAVPYFLLIAALTVVFADLLLEQAWSPEPFGRPDLRWIWLALLTLVMLPFTSQAAISLVNWLATLIIPTRGLPQMDYDEGIPDDQRTLVAIPTLLDSRRGVDELVAGLEIRYLANRSPNLCFGLVTDFSDAPAETMPEDQALLDYAVDGIRELNARYASESEVPIFMLLHRRRTWNEAERTWMGWERKRGKLEELNRLLRGGSAEPFLAIEGDLETLHGVRYVITLDADTQLPPGTAARMVATMAHPLNRPRVNPRSRRVDLGYGMLQPRVAISLAGATRSLFSRLFVGEVGIDPYTREVSNAYHDLFGQGQFIGKGIYDVKIFDQVLGHRFPSNRILSHDLIEGCHIRCGFLNDVELIEDCPSRYLADVSRRHRWIRGDWQIAAWLLPWAPAQEGRRQRNRLDTVSRWMIFDNLRRSVVPLTMLLLLLGGWLLFPVAMPAWTASILGIYFAPDIVRAVFALVMKGRKTYWHAHLWRVALGELRQAVTRLLHLALLPFEVWFHLDAVLRVIWRLAISHRRLLEWQTARDAERRLRPTFASIARALAPASVLAAALGVAVWRHNPFVLTWAAPFVAAWFLAPLWVWVVSRPLGRRRVRLSDADNRFLRRLARRTWMFFELFVGPGQHWLPPDNFQEQPQTRIAVRTSPTNIGLSLLSTLTACDFGYVSVGDLVERTEKTFATLERLERYRGHFFNWYDTRTCQPLHPRYVSTVDSGNLAASLVALRSGLRELVGGEILPPKWRDGLDDVAGVLTQTADQAAAVAARGEPREQLQHLVDEVRKSLAALPPPDADLAAVERALAELADQLAALEPLCQRDVEAGFWLAAMRRQTDDLRNDLAFLLPWLADGRNARTPEPDPSTAPAEIAGAVVELRKRLADVRTLKGLARLDEELGAHLDNLAALAAESSDTWTDSLQSLRQAVAEAAERAARRNQTLDRLALQCDEFADQELDFLYDGSRKLLAIGYSCESHRRDTGYYDLLASEARLTSFLGIAQGKLPQEHWFLLGRQLTPGNGSPSLVSWSGSMFEYLMPTLLMPCYPNTLIDRASRGAVLRQIRYSRRRHVPWGISESCYNQVDTSMNYQYRAFGVPELGLKRGLADDLVIAPYAAAMALMVLPEKACRNLAAMERMGFVGRFGLYEAVDYTASRVQADQPYALVRCFMSHHGGMAFLALDHLLNDRPMQRRFTADPEVRASLLLLQERVPLAHATARAGGRRRAELERLVPAERGEAAMRIYTKADTAVPAVHLLSNGRYHVMVTNSGAGFSRWNDIAITRWREDVTRDDWGLFFYLHDVDAGEAWSATAQPMGRKLDRYEVVFSQGKAEFRAVRNHIEAYTQIAVSPEDDIELRRLTLTNLSSRTRTVELTSYAEVVLNEVRAERGHPAFNSLFIQTETLDDRAAILCTRRPRSADESPPWVFHALNIHGETHGHPVSFETDRARFLGRDRTAARPQALDTAGPLSNTAGSVLDPNIAIRWRLRLAPGEAVTVDAITGIDEARDEAVTLVDKYRDRRLADRVFELAWTQSQVLLHQLRATEADAQLFLRFAGSIIFANPRYRAGASVISRNEKSQSDLWRYSISGDLPIVLVRITDPAGLNLVRRAVQAHGYWRHKGLRVDLVIWADAFAGYRQSLVDQVIGLINAGPEAKSLNQPGGILVRSADQLPDDDQILLQSVARIVLTDRAGSFAEQADRRSRGELPMGRFRGPRQPEPAPPDEQDLPPRELVAFNGYGGFTPDGREYAIVLRPGMTTPAPWSNVIANNDFGTVVTQSGGAYTWVANAHEYRLTPWYNDPVRDVSGEAFYIRDEETGKLWSPSPQPANGETPYVCRHGLGYSVFEHRQDGIYSEAWTYVALEAPVKMTAVTLRNLSGRDRRLSVTGYCEWVLGDLREATAMHVVTRLDAQTGAIFATNTWGGDFKDRIAFFQSSVTDRAFTGDRTEFIGRNGDLAAPAGLRHQRLSDRVGAGLDPCAAIQSFITIPAGQERQVVFVLGAARSEAEAHGILNLYSGIDGARHALEAVWQFWKHVLGGVYVETPDPAVNFLVNHWLLYQVLAGRFWGRSGYYQSGGAFGFRDQLQDSMALLHECPHYTRSQLLLSAARQFAEGDVQHWWHPPTGRGVRTHISDDYLWLPYAVCRYVETTGDTGVLDEQRAFLGGRPVDPDEESYYDLPHESHQQGTLYEHCLRAIRHGLRFGAHGLPLMGAGDWNDGLNRVGRKGRGESVWLGFFLYEVLTRFAALARRRNDDAVARECHGQAETLKKNLKAQAWDGRWYLRAFFDDGRPLGSSQSPECQIDALPQSWSVLTGVGDPERTELALKSVLERLVDWDLRLVKLLDPPFDKAPWDPGYIRGYIPGVRENGGQYTHAAIWTVMAFAALHHNDQTWKLFEAINPVRHGDTPERIAAYKVEPYVVAADVYTAANHEGRGGWTWYTGSAGWMYQLLVERMLGISLKVDTLTLAPVLPTHWKTFTIHYRFRATMYHISVDITGPSTWHIRSMTVDGADQPDRRIHMVDDHRDHFVRVEVG